MSNALFQQWLDAFFESYYRQRPVNATFVGEHAWDSALPDWSAAGLAAQTREMESLLAASEKFAAVKLSPDEVIDLRLAQGFLRIQLWEIGSQHFQRGNPSLYIGEAVFSIVGLMLNDYAPVDERLDAAVLRMAGIPDLLAWCSINVKHPPQAWAQKALQECIGARELFGEGLDIFLRQHGLDRPDVRTAADGVLLAIEVFEDWLQKKIAKGVNEVACGEEAFAMLMREGHFLNQTPDEIAAYAIEQMELAKAEVRARAQALGSDDWRGLMAQLSDIHPSRNGYYARYQELWDACKALSDANELVTWPDFPIEYIPQPEWARKAAPHLYFLFYRAPAAVNRPPVHHYLVTPIEPGMSASEQNRRLRATNESVIKLNHVVHHGSIGHHVQNWYAYRAPTRFGRMAAVDTASRIAMFCGGTMAEGWACYATTLMQEAGFLTPLEELSEAHGRVRMAARAIVDVKLHKGEFTLAEAAKFYEENTAMPEAASWGEAVKNSMFPGAAMIYLIGHDAIHDLRKQMQAEQGEAFDLKGFHNAFLSHGSIPVALIAEQMRAGVAQAA